MEAKQNEQTNDTNHPVEPVDAHNNCNHQDTKTTDAHVHNNCNHTIANNAILNDSSDSDEETLEDLVELDSKFMKNLEDPTDVSQTDINVGKPPMEDMTAFLEEFMKLNEKDKKTYLQDIMRNINPNEKTYATVSEKVQKNIKLTREELKQKIEMKKNGFRNSRTSKKSLEYRTKKQTAKQEIIPNTAETPTKVEVLNDDGTPPVA